MALSPMMTQYLKIKEENKDSLLFFRLGDFYEMFFDDAIIASKELDLILTGRDCGLSERAPMCGVPFHAVDGYIAKLMEKGYKVSICEQTSVPGAQKGIVKREIVKTITPGTVMDHSMLNDKSNNYLVSIFLGEDNIGVAWSDISTGELGHSQITGKQNIKLNELLSRLEPSEIICNEQMLQQSLNLSVVKFGSVCPFALYQEQAFDYKNAYITVSSYFSPQEFSRLKGKIESICATGALLAYVKDTQKQNLSHLKLQTDVSEENHMIIDARARKTLELLCSSEGKTKGSLLWVLDRTKTSMGARMLKQWLTLPSNTIQIIQRRLDLVEAFVKHPPIRDKIVSLVAKIKDIERIASRISNSEVTPKECVALASSLRQLPSIKELLGSMKDPQIDALRARLCLQDDLVRLIDTAILPEPSNLLRDGGIMNNGFDADLDEYRNTSKNAKTILATLEKEEKEETGIKNLKIGFNKVFGYYIEVLKSQVNLVPYRYHRKQTIAGAERYITEELKEIENKILKSEELALARELTLYNDLIFTLKQYVQAILSNAKAIAALDCFLSNAVVASEYNYSKPTITDGNAIEIVDGRHAVVERLLKSENFVPNDTRLDNGENKIMLITGPNMAGKSIYMRQVALIAIMAHMGSFVPAKKADICLIDKIFTRVGASDDLNTGRSTFMVEMIECSSILDGATDRSLILLDELGRGTSTYDGMSIAYAVLKYIATHTRAKTLFSTHYHELTELEGTLPELKNFYAAVRELNGDIIFMHKILKGAAGRSYGIEVAKLAALPDEVIADAKQILKHLERQSIGVSIVGDQLEVISEQEKPSVENALITKLKVLDTDLMSPMEALNFLISLKKDASRL